MSLRVLLADDQLATRHIVRFNLERFGFEVLDATDGLDAWNILQKERIHLVITDESMPRLAGMELCARIRQTPWMADLPVILITGVVPFPTRETMEKLAIAHCFVKPFSPREMVDKVCEVLHARCG